MASPSPRWPMGMTLFEELMVRMLPPTSLSLRRALRRLPPRILSLPCAGELVLDDGAARAMANKKSLLPAGTPASRPEGGAAMLSLHLARSCYAPPHVAKHAWRGPRAMHTHVSGSLATMHVAWHCSYV